MLYVFVGARYYASGGWFDFAGECSSRGEAEAAVRAWIGKNVFEEGWFHVVDVESKKIVVGGGIEWDSFKDRESWSVVLFKNDLGEAFVVDQRGGSDEG